ncbi:MAG: heme exporter protein CcmB [Rubrivivax sp.]|nr:heme exporter protein CcmB [Rubrivivax sp.]
MREVFLTVLMRDLKLASRRRIDSLLPLVFFLVAISLFPLGVGPEPQTLRDIGPGIVWVCALLASMLSVNTLFAGDHADGSLEQMLLAPQPAIAVAAAKCTVHWLVSGLPLLVASPVVALMFGMSPRALGALEFGLLLGTPILSLLGGLGAALTLGLRSGGMLLILIVLPLTMPALIFGAGAVGTVEAGQSAAGHFSLLGALLIATLIGAPWATAAALRISTE